jgi:hypothetical protein
MDSPPPANPADDDTAEQLRQIRDSIGQLTELFAQYTDTARPQRGPAQILKLKKA